MKENKYQALSLYYQDMRNRFATHNNIAWLILFIHIFLAIGSYTAAKQTGIKIWSIVVFLYCICTIFISITMNVKLIMCKTRTFSLKNMAEYLVCIIAPIMISIELCIVSIVAIHSWIPSLLFLLFTIIVCLIFGIFLWKRLMKQIQDGLFQGNLQKMQNPGVLWIWGITALPIIPLLSLIGRKLWFASLNYTIQSLLIMYALMWFWMILIYSVFIKAIAFIYLERN